MANRENKTQWYDSELGQRVIGAIAQQLQNVLPKFFGFHLLQIGKAYATKWLEPSPISHQIVLCPNARFTSESINFVRGDYNDLPFLNDSLDVVILPCVLEFMNNPKKLIEEAWRVLIPNGKLVIVGFNPVSLWGLTRLMKFKRDEYPWSGKFITMGKVKHWLKACHAEINQVSPFYYQPPFVNQTLHDKLLWTEKLSRFSFAPFNGLYLIVATKNIASVTPIKSSWKSTVIPDDTLATSNLSSLSTESYEKN